MAKPVGIIAKHKDNSNKKYRENAEWQAGKRLGRKKQVFDATTKTWSKV